MEDTLTVDQLKSSWKSLSDKLEGDFSFKEYEKAEVNAGIIEASIEFKYNGFDIKLHQGIFDHGMGRLFFNPIEIVTFFNSNTDFYLNLWHLDFLDKLLSWNRKKTGFREFDKLIGIEGETEQDIIEFFKNEKIRNIFVDNRYYILKISKVEKKIMLKGVHSSANIARLNLFIDSFFILLNQLKETIRITPRYNAI
jgi:hypothetical protein